MITEEQLELEIAAAERRGRLKALEMAQEQIGIMIYVEQVEQDKEREEAKRLAEELFVVKAEFIGSN